MLLKFFNNTNTVSSLLAFQKRISNIINFIFIASISIYVISFIIILIITSNNDKNIYLNNLSNANALLQYNISTQLNIIFNDQNFINYIRAGSITRDSSIDSIKWLFSNLNHHLIKGIKIEDVLGNNLYSEGNQTEFFSSISLCYLSNQINNHFGACNYNAVVYFDKSAYLQNLNFFDHEIFPKTYSKTFSYNPFENSFGGFISNKHSSSPIYIKYSRPIHFSLISSSIIILLLFLLAFVYSHTYLKKQIYITLVKPLKSISSNLNNDDLDKLNSHIKLNEFIQLINVVKEYNNQQINTKLNEFAAIFAHDLRGPINGIRILLPKISNDTSNKKYLDLINSYLNQIFQSSKDVLEKYRTKDLVTTIESDNKNIFLLNNLIYEIINSDEKWATIQLNINIDNNIVLYLSKIELFRKINNLLNNAYESLDKEIKEISIVAKNSDEYCYLEIKDNGCGIDSRILNEIIYGKSTKHDGTGFGLSSAVTYFNKIGGDLSIKSQLYYGTSITMTLPNHLPNIYTKQIVANLETIFFIADLTMSTLSDLHDFLSYADIKNLISSNLKTLEKQLSDSISASKNAIIHFNFLEKFGILENFSILSEFNHIYICISQNTVISKIIELSNHQSIHIILEEEIKNLKIVPY